jgi:hypothetical protein
MIDLQLTDKTHDEERQGEALVIDALSHPFYSIRALKRRATIKKQMLYLSIPALFAKMRSKGCATGYRNLVPRNAGTPS